MSREDRSTIKQWPWPDLTVGRKNKLPPRGSFSVTATHIYFINNFVLCVKAGEKRTCMK